MIPEIGLFFVILATLISLTVLFAPLFVKYYVVSDTASLCFVRGAAVFQMLFLFAALFCLVYSFWIDDFSVAYVYYNSSVLLPSWYKVSAVWGAHKGSFLLWCCIFSLWMMLVAFTPGRLTYPVRIQMLVWMSAFLLAFLSFLLFTSNPFERILPYPPLDGADLNPVLQDIGLILHPPMLYVGYIGFAVAFSFALTALVRGSLELEALPWLRRLTLGAWSFLTLGIMLGSWWAYYELGWGGWWFWDPVENVSLMPWIAGTALLHALILAKRSQAFFGWFILLAILTFALCLLGAFIVRSGVLTSVHAFASDPERGLFILSIFFLMVGSALLLYALRQPMLVVQQKKIFYGMFSRIAFILLNNILLLVAFAIVLLGTLFPIFYEWWNDGQKISVGMPYFNTMLLPVFALLGTVLGLLPWLPWKKDEVKQWQRPLIIVAIFSFVIALLIFYWASHSAFYTDWYGRFFIGWLLGVWVLVSHLLHLFLTLYKRQYKALSTFLSMWLGHLGFAITLLGVFVAGFYSSEVTIRLSEGESYTFRGLHITFESLLEAPEENYIVSRAKMRLIDDDTTFYLLPEKRYYPNRQMTMTEAAISAGFWHDIYVALGQPLDTGAWSVRLQYKPLVRWIWGGGILMVFGILLAFIAKRLFKD